MFDLLITGGAGFAGSALAILFKEKYPTWKIGTMDNLKRRGSELNLVRLKNAGIEFFHGDIRNYEDFESLPPAQTIIECSAEPSVMAGIGSSPDYLINTNLIGTINALKYANKHSSTFLFISTSRIYPIKNLEQLNYVEANTRFEMAANQNLPGADINGINELFPLNGARSFYGTTKLASELLIEEYNSFNNLKTVINRCGVLTGPWQMGKIDQGVVVLWMAKHYFKKELSYIGYNGTGKQVRDILHIADLFTLLDWQLQNIDLVNGNIYNVGGGTNVSVSLFELTTLCNQICGHSIPIHQVKENRTADIPIYITNNKKIESISNWQPIIPPVQILTEVFDWIKANEASLKPILA
jgi:CDP-paratose 2-epimerase